MGGGDGGEGGVEGADVLPVTLCQVGQGGNFWLS